MRVISTFILVIFIFCMTVSAQDTKVSEESEIAPIKLGTAEDALSRALEITGFEKLMKVGPFSLPADSLAKKVVIENDSTPFLSDLIIGRQLWQVRLADVDIRTPLAKELRSDRFERKTFDVLLDPNTGKILKIHSIPLNMDSICTLLHTVEEATARLKHKGKIYHGIPDESPKATFIEAINAATGCGPVIANEISAQYILYSKLGSDPIPVWCITSLGIPPVHLTSLSEKTAESDVSLECWTCIVDAMSGRWMSQAYVPCDPPEYERKEKSDDN